MGGRALLALVGCALGGALFTSGCLERPLCADCSPRTTNIFVETVDAKAVSALDLLFMIDNSASMADKQQVLAEAVPDLVARLVTPNCVVADTGEVKGRGPDGTCPNDAPEEFEPVADIHVGVITSSLGSHGAEHGCVGQDGAEIELEEVDDHAHLLGTRPRFLATGAGAGPAPLLAPEGFLNWNPKAVPGQTAADLSTTFQVMTQQAGELGCGYEAQLESVYRFLVDPAPPRAIVRQKCGGGDCAVPSGVDEELLRERAAFLRPRSLVAVLLLTDENDCSIRDEGQAFIAADPGTSMWRGSAACAQNPNDRCCYSCGQTKIPDGCPVDPACGRFSDNQNLRCFDQKRRFGYDFLYPTARYVNALTKPMLCTSRSDLNAADPAQCADGDHDQKPDLVPNPLFAGGRAPSLVFLAGILGVPWQDIRADESPAGRPYAASELHYKTAAQLAEDKTWDLILGDPTPPGGAPPRLPLDGLMVESSSPRNGTDVNGKPIAGPDATLAENDAIHGHDWNALPSDLEYACTFPLPRDPLTGKTSRTCAADALSCDCTDVGIAGKSPLCQNPQTGDYGPEQFYAKAYPGLRELTVLRDFGKNAIVASICARNLARPDAGSLPQDYGYRPAVDALVDRLKDQLTGECLPRRLQKDPQGQYPCSILEARKDGGGCDPARGRLLPRSGVVGPAEERLYAEAFCGHDGQPACDALTLCELAEAGPECHHDHVDQPRAGWCYVDPAENPGDDLSLVKNCPATRRRTIRFVDPEEGQTPAPDSRVVIACSGADLSGEGTGAGGGGAPVSTTDAGH